MVLAKFRQHYPQGSLIGELIDIDRGTYIVGVSVVVDNITLSTGLAGADTVETAEDLARERAIAALMLDSDSLGKRNAFNSETKAKNDAAQILPRATPSVKAVPSPSASGIASEEQTNVESDRAARDSYSTLSTSPDDASVSSPSEKSTSAAPLSFEPEVEAQIENDVQIRENTPEERKSEQPSSNSANLFAGTSNLDIANNTLEDNSQISTEDSTSAAIEPKITQAEPLEEVNFNEIKHQTDLEIKRLGWTKDDGREFLKSRYGKRSRLQLTDNQLLEFLQYLASQPSPS